MKKIFTFLFTLCLFLSVFVFSATPARAAGEDVSNNTDSIEEDMIVVDVSDDAIVSENDEETESEMEPVSIRPPDTTIELTLSWYDSNNVDHPLRFTRVTAYRMDAITNLVKIEVFDGFTDQNGKVFISFSNALFDDSCDLYVVVYAQGTDVEVYNANDEPYSYTFSGDNSGNYNFVNQLNNITPTHHSITLPIFNRFKNSATEDYVLFCEALEISQYAICASMYYEFLKEDDVEDVDIIYPHDEDEDSSFYRSSEQTIYIQGPYILPNSERTLFPTCDVITHEYGHHVGHCEEITNGPGGWHSGDMAKHYKEHFTTTTASNACKGECAVSYTDANGNPFLESECKEMGCRIAWSEGFATFFGEVAQQYFRATYMPENAINISNFADSTYSFSNLSRGIEARTAHGSESEEWIVANILYDLYDDYTVDETFDLFSLGNKAIFNCLSSSQASTLYEFINYFKNSFVDSNEATNIGTLLNEYRFTASLFEVFELNSFALTIAIPWNEGSSVSSYYQAKRFQANFYNSSYELIGSTNAEVLEKNYINRYILAVDGSLWETIMNSYSEVYLSITVYECDGNTDNFGNDSYYTTGYESSYLHLTIPSLYNVLNYGIPQSNVLTSGDCDWYKFTAPWADTFVFVTTGTMDTYGDVFSFIAVGDSINNRLAFNDDGGEGTNFKVSIYLQKNQTVYIRVRDFQWSASGGYTISVSAPNHVHAYTYNYMDKDTSSHYSYCACGDHISESHSYISIVSGNRCKFCNHFEKHIMVPILSIKKPNIDSESEMWYYQDEDS